MAHGPVQYYGGGDQNPTQPAPPYSANQSYGNNNQEYYGNNQGYYGQQNGVELQPPNNSYYPQGRGGENVYSPPSGPPPNNKN